MNLMICKFCRHEFNANYTYSRVFCSEFCAEQGQKEQLVDFDSLRDEGYDSTESENDCYD